MDTDIETVEVTITQPSPRSSSKRKKISKGVKLFGGVVLGFWMIIVVIAIIGAIPLAQVIVGSMHKNACPIDSRIPTYLIVAGAVGLALIVITFIQSALEEGGAFCLILQIPLFLFNFVWFIVGNVWVFSAKPTAQFHDPSDPTTYCHGAVFNCAFVTIIITYVLMYCSLCCGGSYRANQ